MAVDKQHCDECTKGNGIWVVGGMVNAICSSLSQVWWNLPFRGLLGKHVHQAGCMHDAMCWTQARRIKGRTVLLWLMYKVIFCSWAATLKDRLQHLLWLRMLKGVCLGTDLHRDLACAVDQAQNLVQNIRFDHGIYIVIY
jgi:hypothetical protein